MEPHVYVTNDPMTVTVSTESTVVDIEGGFRPTIIVSYGGGRGPIWLPGNTYTGDTLADILTGYITKGQLSNDLKEEIERSSTGLDEAALALEQAILDNNSAINAVYSRIEDAEDSISLSAGRLLTAENDISTVKLDITDAMFRVSAAEGDITDLSDFKVAQETLLKNEWTVKIQENTDGTSCVAGIGLLMYPNWEVNSLYELDDYVWFDDGAYKAKTTHTALTENTPPNSTYWEYIPYATKSQFGVLADSFFIQTTSGDKTVPFMVQNDKVIINGDLLVDQLITSSIMSTNYIPGIRGYSLNASTGEAEFNNITLTITYNDLTDKPLDSDIYNSYVDTSNFVTTTTLNQNIAALQSQIDGAFTTWYYEGVPSLTNEPAVNWTTPTLKDVHIGDLYYDELTGTAYRFKNDTGYEWSALPNTDLTVALANAANAQDTADSKRRVFVVQPTGPYDIGDLWVTSSIVKCANTNRTTGYSASEWDDAASLGAPIGTLVAGVSASTIATAATNFNLSNDRNNTAVVAPTVLADGTCVNHTIRTDGSADISFEWLWVGNEGDIDGFQVIVYQATSSSAYTIGTSPASEQVYTIPANKRAFILYGVTSNLYYTIAVRAYRAVDKDINATGVIVSPTVKSLYSGENPYRPSSTVAYAGNVIGTINGIAAANVNVWANITGSDKPANNATANTIYRQATAPTGGTYTTGDLWIDTDAVPTTLAQWDGTDWVIIGNYTTNTSQLADGANLGGTATWNGVTGTGKPSDNATANTIYRQATEPTGGTYTTGDLWFNTGANPPALYNWNGSSWVVVSNTVTNTNQIADGANLGSTAIWGSISGTGKPEDNATVGAPAGTYIGSTLAQTIEYRTNDPAARINANSTIISGSKISTGTIYACTLSTAYSGRRVEISHYTNDIKVYSSSGSQIVTLGENASGGFISSITGNYTLPAIYGESFAGVCVMGSGWGANNAVVGYTHRSDFAGVEGYNWATGSKGIIGYAGWDFYACGSGTNYGAFTGGHDALLVKGEHIPIGYIVEDVLCINKRNISSTIFTLAKSTLASRPIGVIATIARPLTDTEYASGLIDSYDQDNLPLFIDGYTTLCKTYNLITFNAVGEGQVYVCGENGDMVNGDLICCSSIPGIGMKQLDDIVRNTTVAKVRGAVSFTDTTTIQLVPCIYLCG